MQVRELHSLGDLRAAAQLFDSLWREPDGSSPLNAHLLRALQLSGNPVTGAFEGEEMVGASVAWATPPPVELHSHATGVVPGIRRRGAGLALKIHQREWALAHGITTIRWTFDPLVARNTNFNLSRLAARATAYEENVYGEMHDGLNAGHESDRVIATWELDRPEVVAAATGGVRAVVAEPEGGLAAVRVGPDGRPELVPGVASGPGASAEFTVALPSDIEALRMSDPDGALLWRLVIREVLGGAMAAGATVLGVDRRRRLVVAS